MAAYRLDCTSAAHVSQLISELNGRINQAELENENQSNETVKIKAADLIAKARKNLKHATDLLEDDELQDAFDQANKALAGAYAARGKTVQEWPKLNGQLSDVAKQAGAGRPKLPPPAPATTPPPPVEQRPRNADEQRNNMREQLSNGVGGLNSAAEQHERELCQQLGIPYEPGRRKASEAEAKQKLEDASRARRQQHRDAQIANDRNNYNPAYGVPFNGPLWRGNHPLVDYGYWPAYGGWGGFHPGTSAFIPIMLAETMGAAIMPGYYDPLLFGGYVYGLDYGWGGPGLGGYNPMMMADPLFVMEVEAVNALIGVPFDPFWGDPFLYSGAGFENNYDSGNVTDSNNTTIINNYGDGNGSNNGADGQDQGSTGQDGTNQGVVGNDSGQGDNSGDQPDSFAGGFEDQSGQNDSSGGQSDGQDDYGQTDDSGQNDPESSGDNQYNGGDDSSSGGGYQDTSYDQPDTSGSNDWGSGGDTGYSGGSDSGGGDFGGGGDDSW